MARATPPEVVISAMHLPDMTGIQLAQKMTDEASLSSTCFVLITSQAKAQEANLPGLAQNVVRLQKPFDLDQLCAALAAAVDTPSQKGPRGLKVLIVDDSAAARAHVRTVFAGLGVDQMTEASDGAEALVMLETVNFDLVVTDYNMPRLDGRGLIDFIRRRSSTPSVPVIIVTTETEPSKLDAVRQLGVAAICDKSFKSEVVGEILARLR